MTLSVALTKGQALSASFSAGDTEQPKADDAPEARGQRMLLPPFSVPRFPDLSAAAAKSLQSCPTLCNPTDGRPRGSSVPGILQARTLGEDKPPWQGFGKAHCNTVCNVLHSIHHTKVSSWSSSSNPSSWSGPAPAGLSLQRNLLTWHRKSLSSTFSSVISLPSHPSLFLHLQNGTNKLCVEMYHGPEARFLMEKGLGQSWSMENAGEHCLLLCRPKMTFYDSKANTQPCYS